MAHLHRLSVLLLFVALGCSDLPTGPLRSATEEPQQRLHLASPQAGAPQAPDAYIVVLRPEVRDVPAAAQALAQAHGLGLGFIYQHALRGFSATIPAGRLQALARDARVLRIEPDYIATTMAQVLPWGVDRIDADLSSTQAGDGRGSVGIDVYILDTGVSLHKDLNVAERVDFTGQGVDDKNGHGTHVAGTVAALDNSAYVVGVAPGARIRSFKVLGNNGSGQFSWIIAAVDEITRRKLASPSTPMVANMSLGAKVGTTAYSSLDEAIVRSIQAGVVYCIAAGNSGEDASLYSPAHVVEAITVGAYDANNQFASFSNYGSILDLQAPGVSILSTWLRNRTHTLSGTSMATPHVTGSAALYLARTPSASPQEVRNALVSAGKAWVVGVPSGTTNVSVYAGSY
jgi:subtilisin family serine protease